MNKMKCREYEKQVQSFLKDEMNDTDMRAFMEHVQICPRCYEELEIYHSVYNGLELMEQNDLAADNQDFSDTRLRTLLEKRRQRMMRNRVKRIAFRILFVLCMIGVIGMVGFAIADGTGVLAENWHTSFV